MVAALMGGACTIGVDVGGTKLLAGVVDEGLAVHSRAGRRVPRDDQGALLDAVVDAVEEVAAAAPGPVSAVGLGVACLFDQRRRVAVSSVHLPLVGVALEAVLGERLGLPVVVDNDATAAIVAEWLHGAARGASDAVMLTIGTGVGGGLVVGGALARGALGAAGELGPVRVEPDAPAAPEDAVVPLHQRIEGGPGLGAERRDGVRRLGNHAAPYPVGPARTRRSWLCRAEMMPATVVPFPHEASPDPRSRVQSSLHLDSWPAPEAVHGIRSRGPK